MDCELPHRSCGIRHLGKVCDLSPRFAALSSKMKQKGKGKKYIPYITTCLFTLDLYQQCLKFSTTMN